MDMATLLRAYEAEQKRQAAIGAAAGYVPEEIAGPMPGAIGGPAPPQRDWRAAGLEPPPTNFLDAMQQNKAHNARAAQMLWEMTPPGSFMSAVDAADRGDGLGVVMGAIGAVPIPGAGALGVGGKGAVKAAGKAAGIAGDATKGIRAYHGSPHSFDRFDLSKIGTGEGAQAYGHGLYFAGVEDVARQYRDQLRWKGANFDDPQVIARNAIDRNGNRDEAATSLQSALDSTANFYRGKIPPSQAEANRRTEQAIALLKGKSEIIGQPPTPGHMYEVNLRVAPDQMLDWDRPLSKQSDDIRAGVERAFTPYREPGWTSEGHMGDRSVGANMYDLGHAKFAGSPAAASEALRREGIPGIRYLDGGSRNNASVADLAGTISTFERALKKHPNDEMLKRELDNARKQMEIAARGQTSNYVLFDDKLIDILRKYGLLPLGAGGAAAGAAAMPGSIGGSMEPVY